MAQAEFPAHSSAWASGNCSQHFLSLCSETLKTICGEGLQGKVGSDTPSGLQKATTVGGVERLTDTSKYTGTHKERFDESGKGKGIEGREDTADNSGYVSGYKGAGTYDRKSK